MDGDTILTYNRRGRLWQSELPGDAGVTLIELIVTMVLLASFSALFSVAVSQMNPVLKKQQGIYDATNSARTAFLLLDKQVRYADTINPPGVANGYQYVEYRWQRATATDQTAWCTQWRVQPVAGLLQQRQWVDGAFVATQAWNTVVTGVTGATTSGTGAVFNLPAATTNAVTALAYQAQQLTFSITVNSNKPIGRASTNITLTAANSVRSVAPTAVCGSPTSRTP